MSIGKWRHAAARRTRGEREHARPDFQSVHFRQGTTRRGERGGLSPRSIGVAIADASAAGFARFASARDQFCGNDVQPAIQFGAGAGATAPMYVVTSKKPSFGGRMGAS